jgi:hypothetical protein
MSLNKDYLQLLSFDLISELTDLFGVNDQILNLALESQQN